MPPPLLATVRASSWSDLMDCATRWYYKNIMGLRLPARGNAVLGTALHASTAVWDRATLADQPIEVADAVEVLHNSIEHPQTEAEFDDEDMTRTDAHRIGESLTVRYVETVAPAQTYEAVELLCNALDVETDAGVVRLTGTTDRIQRTPAGRGIVDLKSGKTAVKPTGVAVTRGHGLQLGVYQLMAEHASGEIMTAPPRIIGFHTRPNALRVGVGDVLDSKRALIGDAHAPGVIELAARMLRAGVFPPNPKSNLCSPKYCPGYSRCPYHD